MRVAVIVRGPDLIAPTSPGGATCELSGIAWQLLDWPSDPSIGAHQCTSFLLVENLNDLHRLVSQSGQAAPISIALLAPEQIEAALATLARKHPVPLPPFAHNLAEPAVALAGATLNSIENLVQTLPSSFPSALP